MRFLESSQALLTDLGLGVEKFFSHNSAGRESSGEHGHRFIEMVYLVRGELKNQIDRVGYIQSPGELAIINYGSSHSLYCRKTDLYNVYLEMNRFPLDRLPPGVRRVLEPVLAAHPALVNRRNLVRLVALENAGFMEALLERMVRWTREGARDELFYGAGLFLTELARSLESRESREPGRSSSAFHDGMERAVSLLERDFSRKITLEEISRTARCSPSHFCRLFKGYTRKTMGAYLRERRLRQAMFLLTTTDDKITAVAVESGFSDISRFNKEFKAFTGMTPGLYRRSRGSDEKEGAGEG